MVCLSVCLSTSNDTTSNDITSNDITDYFLYSDPCRPLMYRRPLVPHKKFFKLLSSGFSAAQKLVDVDAGVSTFAVCRPSPSSPRPAFWRRRESCRNWPRERLCSTPDSSSSPSTCSYSMTCSSSLPRKGEVHKTDGLP